MFGQMGLKTLVIRDTKAGESYQNIQMFKKQKKPQPSLVRFDMPEISWTRGNSNCNLRCHHYDCVSAFIRNIDTLPECCERQGVNYLNGPKVWYYDFATNNWMLDSVLLKAEPLRIKFHNYWIITYLITVSPVIVNINIFCNTHANKD